MFRIDSHRIARTRGASLIELICIIGLIAIVFKVSAPMFLTVFREIPRLGRTAGERNCLSSLVDKIYTKAASADSVTFTANVLEINCGDETYTYEVGADGKSVTQTFIRDDQPRIDQRELLNTRCEILPWSNNTSGKLVAVNLRICDIYHVKKVAKSKNTLNYLIFLKGGNTNAIQP